MTVSVMEGDTFYNDRAFNYYVVYDGGTLSIFSNYTMIRGDVFDTLLYFFQY